MFGMKKSSFGLCAGALLACTGAANAQFTDNFDSYTPGVLCPQGGWEEWAGSVDVCGDVSTDFAFDGTQSLKITGNPGGSSGAGDDTIHRFPNFMGGVWEFSIQTYIPTGAQGSAYILLLNTYDDPPGSPLSTYRWSLQVRLDHDVDLVVAEGLGGESVPLIRDQWVEFKAVIDLDNDLVDMFYNGAEFASDRSWINGVSLGGEPRIQCLDLYGNEPTGGGTTGTYFDAISLTQQGEPCAADFNNDELVNSQDFFDFLTAFFATAPNADFNGDMVINSQDFFDFLTAFFAGC
jgi:hypothetical protein